MSFDTNPVPPFTSSDLTATYCAMTTYELLLIELVPLAERLSTRFAAVTTLTSPKSAHPASTVPTSTTNGIPAPNADEVQEAVHDRLNLLGYRVGLGLAERFSRDRPRFLDTLEVIKFLCKELWMVLWKKQVDNLKTNHRVRRAGGGAATPHAGFISFEHTYFLGAKLTVPNRVCTC